MSSKKAFVVGINYEGTSSELNGCINDALSMAELLEENGYDVVLLSDHTETKPTKVNILKGFLDLILSDANTLYFHYSGHGTSVKDRNGDEIDGMDECLCPIDYEKNGFILDDEIRGLLCCMRDNQTLLAVSDSCNSGTVFDLGYNINETGKRWISGKASTSKGMCLLLSGCKDNQTSADAYIDNKYQGALTHFFTIAIEHKLSITNFITSIRTALRDGGYSQTAQLSSNCVRNVNDIVRL